MTQTNMMAMKRMPSHFKPLFPGIRHMGRCYNNNNAINTNKCHDINKYNDSNKHNDKHCDDSQNAVKH